MTNIQEIPLSKIARRKFIQLSAVAAAGCFVRPSGEARAEGLPHLTEDDPVAKSMRYTHDASTVDPASRANPAANQNCANCALVQGEDGEEWRPCQIFPGKAVNANGWCSVWAPKA
ncbi:MAG: high-potential iron-sulfur protein [Woeseiaceae bacterium]